MGALAEKQLLKEGRVASVSAPGSLRAALFMVTTCAFYKLALIQMVKNGNMSSHLRQNKNVDPRSPRSVKLELF